MLCSSVRLGIGLRGCLRGRALVPVRERRPVPRGMGRAQAKRDGVGRSGAGGRTGRERTDRVCLQGASVHDHRCRIRLFSLGS